MVPKPLIAVSPKTMAFELDANVNEVAAEPKATKKARLYYYVDHGFFDIVWPNISVFVIAHVLYVISFYTIATEWPLKTLIYSKSRVSRKFTLY